MMDETSARASGAPKSNPLDDLNIQAPGRLLTLEVLIALAIRRHPDREAVFREAQTILTRIEQQFQAEVEEPERQRLRQMFEVSRSWLAKLDKESSG
jgi:hypothetical protein